MTPAEPGLASVTQTGYEQIRRRYVRGCDEDAHLTRGSTDRDGAIVHVCTRACGAYRQQGDPTWHRP